MRDFLALSIDGNAPDTDERRSASDMRAARQAEALDEVGSLPTYKLPGSERAAMQATIEG